MGRLVVMSGYPAAGKSTLARALAAQPLGVGKLVLVDTTKTVDLEEVAAAMMRGFG